MQPNVKIEAKCYMVNDHPTKEQVLDSLSNLDLSNTKCSKLLRDYVSKTLNER